MVGSRNQPAASLNEGQARYILIDPALRGAGWNLEDRTQVGFEISVDGYDAAPWNGVTDYCLYAPGGEVIAVVEAKRCSRNPREADEQLRHYVSEIARRLLKQRHLVEADLYETLLTVFGRNAVDRYFSPAEIRGLLELTERLAA